MVKEAMRKMEEIAPQYKAETLVLTGDPNLKGEYASACCQRDFGDPDIERDWHMESALGEQCGDVLFCRSAITEPFDIAIGKKLL